MATKSASVARTRAATAGRWMRPTATTGTPVASRTRLAREANGASGSWYGGMFQNIDS